MITSFSIGNFKAFSETQKIPLKPITLIYGANSSGKSSIIHALMLAQHAHKTGDWDVHLTEKGGDSIDLGGFKQYVYKRGNSKFGRNIELSFCIPSDVNRDDQVDNWSDIIITFIVGTSASSVESDMSSDEPKLLSIEAKDSSTIILKMSVREGDELGIDTIDIEHKMFSRLNTKLKKFMSHSINDITMKERVQNRLKEIRYKKKGLFPVFRNSTLSSIFEEYFELINMLMNSNMSSKRKGSKRDDNIYDSVIIDIQDDAIDKYLVELLTPLFTYFENLHSKLIYLGPLRVFPPRHIFNTEVSNSNWQSGGGEAWNTVRKSQAIRDKINKLLQDEKLFKTPYEIIIRNLYDVNQIAKHPINGVFNVEKEDIQRIKDDEAIDEYDIELVDQDIKGIIDFIKRSDIDRIPDIVLMDERSKTIVSHRDIGVGVSQVLPVLAYSYANKDSMIAIEQPEIHLHPALQADLADVFIESSQKDNPNSYLIETHSEYILMRIMRRIRETKAYGKENVKHPLTNQDVSVLFVQPVGESSRIREMKLNEYGELVKNWPKGFFSEFVDDIMPISKKEK